MTRNSSSRPPSKPSTTVDPHVSRPPLLLWSPWPLLSTFSRLQSWLQVLCAGTFFLVTVHRPSSFKISSPTVRPTPVLKFLLLHSVSTPHPAGDEHPPRRVDWGVVLTLASRLTTDYVDKRVLSSTNYTFLIPLLFSVINNSHMYTVRDLWNVPIRVSQECWYHNPPTTNIYMRVLRP